MPDLVKRQPRFLRRRQQLSVQRRYLAGDSTTAGMSGMPSLAGVKVTAETALTFGAYYAGVRVIAEDAASLPLAMFRRKGDRTDLVKDHPVTYFFNRSPDGECNDFNWRESFYSHCISWGNGYAEIEWGTDGQPLKLHLLHPAQVEPKRDRQTKELYYEVQTGRGAERAFPWQILHFAGLGFDGLRGHNVVQMHAEAIGMGKAMEQYGASFFGNGAMPGGIVKLARSLKPEAITNLRNSINAMHQGSANASKLMILEEGHDYVPTQIPPETAQFLASRAFQVIEICRILRLPPNKLQDYTHAHLANIEASNIDYEKNCLRPWTIRLEKTIDLKLLSDREKRAGYYAKHDFRPILLRTAKDKADFYQKMFQIGYYTVDEIKVLEQEDPVGEAKGGMKRFVQAQLVDIEKAGEPPPKGQEPVPPGEPGRPAKFNNSRLNGEVWNETRD